MSEKRNYLLVGTLDGKGKVSLPISDDVLEDLIFLGCTIEHSFEEENRYRDLVFLDLQSRSNPEEETA